jgi:hypothetical protein
MSAEASTSCPITQRVNDAVQEAAIVTKALASREEERPINTRKAYLSKLQFFEVDLA